MPACKVCGHWFVKIKPQEELCDKCESALYRLSGYVAPVIYGRWINITRFNDGEHIIATCSHCKDRGDIRTIRTEFGIWEIDSPYCPHCGAKMQEVD